jgi:hypothetical protein
MLIEGAFYKLPELLLGHPFPRNQYESTLVNYLAMAVLLELNARNVPFPQSRVHIEHPYPIEKAGPANRVDLHVDLEGLFKSSRMPLYGMKTYNWVEVKFHSGLGRSSGTETKTENAGKIARDLLRLSLFVPETRSRHRDNGRYMLVVFNREPSAYLAFQRRGQAGAGRTWLRTMLSPGTHYLEISLADEVATFKTAVGAKLARMADTFVLGLDTITYPFEPINIAVENLYWGYLVRIVNYSVQLASHKFVYRDDDDAMWTQEKADQHKELLDRVLDFLT